MFFSANKRSEGEGKGREEERKGERERGIGSEALAETEKIANAPAGNRTRRLLSFPLPFPLPLPRPFVCAKNMILAGGYGSNKMVSIARFIFQRRSTPPLDTSEISSTTQVGTNDVLTDFLSLNFWCSLALNRLTVTKQSRHAFTKYYW